MVLLLVDIDDELLYEELLPKPDEELLYEEPLLYDCPDDVEVLYEELLLYEGLPFEGVPDTAGLRKLLCPEYTEPLDAEDVCPELPLPLYDCTARLPPYNVPVMSDPAEFPLPDTI